MTAMVDKPKRQSQKFSGPPNRNAKRAKEAEKNNRKNAPTIVPKAEEIRDTCKASSAFPFWHIYSSVKRVVTTELGVPGVQLKLRN